jgi:hypothetical protein
MLTPQVVRPLLFEYLRTNHRGQVANAMEGVAKLAVAKQLVTPQQNVTFGASTETMLGAVGASKLYLVVQQILWQLLPQGVIVWGQDATNHGYPFYRVTEYGQQVLAATTPQPYDPDGFLTEFDRLVPNADAVVRDYLLEAVHAFNSNCPRAAAVLVGCASEKTVLVLFEHFRNAISDSSKQSKFDKDANSISIHRKYTTLKDRLDLMVQGRKLRKDHAETVGSELPSGFELIRRCRNTAGHPELGGTADHDTVFLNLRCFTEYARRTFDLIDYFKTNPADW